MMKHLVSTTAIIFALATPAWAQSYTRQPASQTSPTAPAESQTKQSGTTAEKAIIPEQTGTQLRAENLMGTTVVGPDGKEVGTVDDLIFDEQKKIVGVVVGVGGFLGIGKKDVGLDWQQATYQEDQAAGTRKIQITLTKADLQAAPDFKTKEQQKAEKEAAAAAQQQELQRQQMQQQSAPPAAPGTAPAQPSQ
jgi:sporulation protein YlmC with PRC-barrel domain